MKLSPSRAAGAGIMFGVGVVALCLRGAIFGFGWTSSISVIMGFEQVSWFGPLHGNRVDLADIGLLVVALAAFLTGLRFLSSKHDCYLKRP